MALWMGIAVLLVMAQVVCSTEEDYDLGADRVAGSVNEDSGLDPDGRAKYYCGYKITRHKITSKDGYITTAFRLPRNATGVAAGHPVILQHGLKSNANTWFQLHKNSLPCLLAGAGYDVWVTNARGNRYSREHVSLSIWWINYWRFSFHEMGVFDLPATIDYICKVTKKDRVSYIGHSMGGTMNFVLLSEVPYYNNKIILSVSLAPAVYISKVKSKVVQSFLGILDYLLEILMLGSLAQYSLDYHSNRSKNVNKIIVEGMKALEYILKEEQNETQDACVDDAPEDFSLQERPQRGSGYDKASLKTLNHLRQLISSGQFQLYDYGSLRNSKIYGQPYPPPYKLQNVKTRQLLMYSNNDFLVPEKNTINLCKTLRKGVGDCRRVAVKRFRHSDYLNSRHAKQHVYDVIMRALAHQLSKPRCLG